MFYKFSQVAVLFTILLNTFFANAVPDFSKEYEPLESARLKFKIQFDIAKVSGVNRQGNYIWSTHLKFPTNLATGDGSAGSPTLTDGQMFKMGCDAWEEFKINRAIYGFGPTKNSKLKPPGMISVLLVGDEVFISTSIKGTGSFLYNLDPTLNTAVRTSLERCQMLMNRAATNPSGADPTNHRAGAGCAEIMTAAQWYTKHPNGNLGASVGTKIIAVRMDYTEAGGVETWSGCSVDPPCGNLVNQYWGCDIFTQENNLHPILAATQADYSFDTLGTPVIDQAAVCKHTAAATETTA